VAKYSIHKALNKFEDVIEHHPVPFLCSAILTVLLILDVLNILHVDRAVKNDLQIAFSSAFLASGALGLYLNAQKQTSRFKKFCLTALTAIFMIALGYFSEISQQNSLFLFPGLILLLMSAPFVLSKTNENAVWLFNARFFIAIGLSIIAAILFGGGLHAISSSLDFLLGINVHRDFYEIVWITAIAFVGPVFGLYLMPKDSTEELVLPERSALLARGVTVLINYVLTPMLIIYLVILHLYAAKILATFSLPKGQVALMVLIFSLGLTGFILFARPWQERCTKLTNWLLRFWHFLLFTPLILLAIAVSRRISDYGVTPDRYLLVILGIWLLGLLILPLIKKAQLGSVRILASLAIILVLASFGPWGAKSVSVYSQKSQFIQLLERNNLLNEGKLIKELTDEIDLSSEDSKTGYSIIRFLSKQKAIDSLQPIFTGHTQNPFKESDENHNQWQTAKNIRELFKLTTQGGKFSNNLSYNAGKSVVIDIQRYSAYIPRLSLYNQSKQPLSKPSKNETYVWRNKNKLTIESPSGKFEGDISEIIALVESASKKSASRKDRVALQYKLKNNNGNAIMIISHISFNRRDNKIAYISLNFDLLIE